MTPTPEQIEKLPKWAQDHVKDLERRRDDALSALQHHLGKQYVTPFFFEDMVREAEGNGYKNHRIYLGERWERGIGVEFGGVRLSITCRGDAGNEEITINFERTDRMRGDVMVEPRACNSIGFRLPRP